MGSMMTELIEAIQESEGRADRKVLTMLELSLIHISEPTRLDLASRMPSSA